MQRNFSLEKMKLSIYTLLFNARPLFWNYQLLYIPPSFMLRSERSRLQHPAFLRESQVASIQPFSCSPKFANASVGRKVLNMGNLCRIWSSAWVIARCFYYVCYLNVMGFKDMGLKNHWSVLMFFTDMVGPGF